jgi:hypothetical protein
VCRARDTFGGMWKPLLLLVLLSVIGCGDTIIIEPARDVGAYDAPSSCAGLGPEDFDAMPHDGLSASIEEEILPAGADRFYRSQKLGNKIEFTDQDVDRVVRILEPNIAELDVARNYEAGAWVLTLRSEVQLSPLNPAPNILNTAFARISFGDGSAFTPVDLDISQGASIQLPCGALQVDIIQPQVPALSPFVLPPKQTITATVHRGFSSSPGTRTFYFWANGLAFAGAVPVGAKNVTAWGGPFQPPSVAPGGLFLYAGQGASAVVPALLRFYTAPEIKGMLAVGQRAVLPGQASQFTVDTGGVANTLLAVEFGIQL